MTARCDKCGEPADCVNERGRYLCVDCQWDEAPPPLPEDEKARTE